MNRLAKHQTAVLAFAQYEEVLFTNNLAERDGAPPPHSALENQT